jgi:hypothetical protein
MFKDVCLSENRWSAMKTIPVHHAHPGKLLSDGPWQAFDNAVDEDTVVTVFRHQNVRSSYLVVSWNVVTTELISRGTLIKQQREILVNFGLSKSHGVFALVKRNIYAWETVELRLVSNVDQLVCQNQLPTGFEGIQIWPSAVPVKGPSLMSAKKPIGQDRDLEMDFVEFLILGRNPKAVVLYIAAEIPKNTSLRKSKRSIRRMCKTAGPYQIHGGSHDVLCASVVPQMHDQMLVSMDETGDISFEAMSNYTRAAVSKSFISERLATWYIDSLPGMSCDKFIKDPTSLMQPLVCIGDLSSPAFDLGTVRIAPQRSVRVWNVRLSDPVDSWTLLTSFTLDSPSECCNFFSSWIDHYVLVALSENGWLIAVDLIMRTELLKVRLLDLDVADLIDATLDLRRRTLSLWLKEERVIFDLP